MLIKSGCNHLQFSLFSAHCDNFLPKIFQKNCVQLNKSNQIKKEKKMESIVSLSIIIKIASICLQICTFIGITILLITTCCKKLSTEESDTDVRGINVYIQSAFVQSAKFQLNILHQDLKPKVSKETIKSPAQKRAIAKIKQGEMIPANQSETIDDAISNWGTVQKIERKMPLKKGRQKKITEDIDNEFICSWLFKDVRWGCWVASSRDVRARQRNVLVDAQMSLLISIEFVVCQFHIRL
uniref:Uncharacterized protein n=1 Tax=Wuchereria bancrofti TaxID=6293 RepID=A0A1I8EXB3_WUCBA